MDEKNPVIGGMSLSEYAETGALLRYFERQALAAAGISVERWESARNAWAAAIKKNDGGVLQLWHAAFDTAWQKVQADQPTLDGLRAAATGNLAAERAAAPELPTYLAQKPQPGSPQQTAASTSVENNESQPLPSPGAPGIGKKPMTATMFADTPTSSALLPFGEAKPGSIKAPEPIPVLSPQMTGTQTLSATDEEKIRKLTLPFDKAKAADKKTVSGDESPVSRPPVALTLEQYVSLRVELSVMPEQRMTTLSRYAIPSESALAAIDAHFAAIFSADPNQKQRFSDLCIQYRVWMTSRR